MRPACLLLVVGCATSGKTPGDAANYESVRTHWTREARMLHGVDTALQIGATYKSWNFRSAYVERYARMFKLPEARRKELWAKERIDRHAGHEFYVAAATHSEQWNDLDKAESVWRVALLCDDRQEAEPTDIKRYSKVTATLLEFFPYTDTFSFAYRIVFPRKMPDGSEICGSGTRRMVLRFAGPLGTLDLVWDL